MSHWLKMFHSIPKSQLKPIKLRGIYLIRRNACRNWVSRKILIILCTLICFIALFAPVGEFKNINFHYNTTNLQENTLINAFSSDITKMFYFNQMVNCIISQIQIFFLQFIFSYLELNNSSNKKQGSNSIFIWYIIGTFYQSYLCTFLELLLFSFSM